MYKRLRWLGIAVTVGLMAAGLVMLPKNATAQEGGFALQVTPSPLVATLKPGKTTTVDVKVRNTGTQTEKLKMTPRRFTVGRTGELNFDDSQAPEAASWTKLSTPEFTVQPGQWFTQKVTFAVPKDAGFSYSFAFVISRQDEPENTGAGRQLKGSVAIFTLLTIDRPGATRQLQLDSFAVSQGVYEYLPAKLDVTLKNTGNTIVQPTGNVFIQHSSHDTTPVGTLPVNKASGYILPGSTRTLAVEWDDGFQVLRPAGDGSKDEQLTWNWSNLSHIRFGQYTAKLVAVYNDGQRDVPITGEVSFWVVPWKLLLGLVVVLALLGLGIWSLVRMMLRLPKKKKRIRF